MLIVCKKRSLHWRHRQLKSKLSHRPNESIQSGLVVRFWRHCLLSNKCGFQSRSTTNLAHRLCTESAFKHTSYINVYRGFIIAFISLWTRITYLLFIIFGFAFEVFHLPVSKNAIIKCLLSNKKITLVYTSFFCNLWWIKKNLKRL